MVAQRSFNSFARRPEIKRRKQELEEIGLDGQDINFALKLAFFINAVDSMVFSEALGFVFYHGQNRQGRIVSYNHRGGFYRIFVPGLCQRIKKEWQRQFVNVTKNGNISYPSSRVNKRKLISLREALTGLGFHEVRHRVQRMPRFKPLTDRNPRLNGTTWDIYRQLAKKRRITEKDMLALELSAQRDDRRASRKKMRLTELDAKAIEGVAINLAHMGRPIAKIAAIIRLQAGAGKKSA